LVENKDSVGENSFASGYESKAKGVYSQSLGFKAIARGDYSTAIGKNALAEKINSFAFGDSARAINAEGYAIGRGAVASGYRSFSFGSAGIDTLGNPTDITKARGDYSFAIGQGSESTTIGSFSIGITNIASGEYSTAIGYNTRASGNFSATLGKITTASGFNSTALGYNTKASGSYSTACGLQTIASGYASTSMGYSTVASGAASTAMGLGTKANTYLMVAIGAFNDTTKYHGNNSYNFWYDDDPLFVIGNGKHSGNLSNAITVLKNGYAGIGTKTPATLLHVKGNGRVMNLEGSDHCYIRFYPDGYPAEGASFGFLSNVENYITLENNISSGHIILYPGSGGNTGIGTKNPSYKLDINTGSLANITGARVYWQRITGNSSNSDQLKIFHRRFADGSDYSTAEIKIQKTVDLTDMGYISFKNNYIEIGNGSTAHMTISSGGNVGIGTTTPDQRFVVYNGTTTGRYTTTGWTHTSDIRLKENISIVTTVLSDVLKLQGVRFNFKSDDTKTRQIGFIAQDFEKVFPEFVVTDNNGFKSIAYGQISAVLVEAIKEQQQIIDNQQAEINHLKSIENEISELKTLVNSLITNQTTQEDN
jgi:hypothetical protein